MHGNTTFQQTQFVGNAANVSASISATRSFFLQISKQGEASLMLGTLKLTAYFRSKCCQVWFLVTSTAEREMMAGTKTGADASPFQLPDDCFLVLLGATRRSPFGFMGN